MNYQSIRKHKYDFAGQTYSSCYPNLHKYPATMLPQIGIELFKELNIKTGNLLDPYCGSGTSFVIGLDRGIREMDGFDINPLAVYIAKAKFTKIEIAKLHEHREHLQRLIYKVKKKKIETNSDSYIRFFNVDYWFSKAVLKEIAVIRSQLNKIKNEYVKGLFCIPFSEVIRECSYTRNSEFKLYRMKKEKMEHFNPSVISTFLHKLNKIIDIYSNVYYPLLQKTNINIKIEQSKFTKKKKFYDIVITSPPYGDSKTTVAYGQFSLFSNEILNGTNARQIDKNLMGGKPAQNLYDKGLISPYIDEISKSSLKRALEVSSYYEDLEESINEVASRVAKKGKVIYIVGNRRVKNIQLPTDKFIAEKFEQNGIKHLFTYERALGNKSMPLKNSPSNIKNHKLETITKEYIVACQK